MAVNRVWFANSPINGISHLDRAQIAVGYPLAIQINYLVADLNSYIRRYLNDVLREEETEVWVNNETPSGTVDGANATFTLVSSPNPATSLMLYKDGQMMYPGTAYNLGGATITFTASYIPSTGSLLRAWYRTS